VSDGTDNSDMVQSPHVVILGAGASIASCKRNQEANGRKLPSMDNFVSLLGLEEILDPEINFEISYSQMYDNNPNDERLGAIQERVRDYFSSLILPDEPTIYDYLVLSLRPKDLIATFNWDPFLYQAFSRSKRFSLQLPHLSFLHGCVSLGFSAERGLGPLGYSYIDDAGEEIPFHEIPLLYPVANKDYSKNIAIAQEWERLKSWLSDAKVVTVFGYSAPESDEAAMRLLIGAWGDNKTKNIEQIELINTDDEKVVLEKWKQLVFCDHYDYHNDYFRSRIARSPRRSIEHLIHQILPNTVEEARESDNPAPEDVEDLDELYRWFQPLLSSEKQDE